MRRTLSALFVAIAAAMAPSAFAAGVNFGQEPDPSVLVVRGGLEWIWAAPCSEGPDSCGAPSQILGFRDPTQGEWLASFTDLADLIAAFTLPSGGARCGSPWLNATYNHCDYSDLQNGHIWHSAFCNPAYFNGCEARTTETFLVRGASVPEPETLALMLTGLGLGTLVGRRRQRKQQS